MGTTAGTREELGAAVRGRHFSTVHIVRYFAWAHLPEDLQAVSRPCGVLALQMVAALPDGPELTVGLRKLLEAKDCLTRHAIDAREV